MSGSRSDGEGCICVFSDTVLRHRYCGDGATLISRGRTQGSTGLRNASAEFKKDVQELKQLLQGL